MAKINFQTFKSYFIIITLLFALNTLFFQSLDANDNHIYGTSYSSYFQLPKGYTWGSVPNKDEFIGIYSGQSTYKGDRRFSAFSCEYLITIHIEQETKISIEWKFKKKKAFDDGEDPEHTLFIRDAHLNWNTIWGDMYYHNEEGKEVVLKPFLAFFVTKENKNGGIRGLLLPDRYEGPVFLPLVNIEKKTK
jgi:hypothetical protein